MPLKGIKIEWKFWLSDETKMNNIADKKKTEIINHHFDSLKMKEIFIKQDNKGDCSMFPFLFSKQPNLTKPN